jgi:putative DNA primase/helicase
LHIVLHAEIPQREGAKMSKRKPPHGSYNFTDSDRPRWDKRTTLVDTFYYDDERGNRIYRIEKGINSDGEKVFRLHRRNQLTYSDRLEPDERDDWLPGLAEVRPVLFRLPELINAPTEALVFVCEGEKDASRLASLGLISTTAPFGAGKWKDEYSSYLTVRDVIILPDNDTRGLKHAAIVSRSLLPHAKSIRIVELPGLRDKGDVSDWLDAGRSVDELLKAVHATSPITEFAPPNSEEAMALQFALQHEAKLRFVPLWEQWMTWTGEYWRHEKTLQHMDFSRQIARQTAATAEKGQNKIASANTVAAVLRLARADRRIVATTEQWDADPWSMNTPGGLINLRTGEMRPSQPTDYAAKITAVAPDGDCPLWLSHLDRVTGGDEELQGYLKRMFGYALTGITDEHALFFLYGTGANGKSVTLDTVSDILGSYHRTASVETFTASTRDQHPTDLAMLAGARLVTAVETEEGRSWAESRIKTLTGGDKITARFMRADFFEYRPQFKLVIAGNHKPRLRNVDEAMRRRINLVPFTVTIPKADRNPSLKAALVAEWRGILAWMLEGCLEWQTSGLKTPAVVRSATDDYLLDEDLPGLWFTERCELRTGEWTSSAELYASFKSWAEDGNEFQFTQRRLSHKLRDMGLVLEKRGKNGARGFSGVKLKPEPM